MNDLHLLQIEVHVFVRLKNVWSLVQDIVQEFSHQEGGSLVFFSRDVHLILQIRVVVL